MKIEAFSLGFDWLGISFPLGVDRRAVAAPLTAGGIFFGADWIAEEYEGDRYNGIGGRAVVVNDRLRVDISGGFWPLELLSAMTPALTALPGAKIHRFDLEGEKLHGD